MTGMLLHTIRFERSLQHAREKVWRAITDPGELAHWFPANVEGAREEGAALRFVFRNEEGPPLDGRVLVFVPQREFEFTWDQDTLRFVLEGDTSLAFTHTFDDLEKAARDAAGWHFCLDALEARLDGREPAAFSMERFGELFARYAKEFGPAASKKKAPGA